MLEFNRYIKEKNNISTEVDKDKCTFLKLLGNQDKELKLSKVKCKRK
jgi:hypothetical protein